MTELELPVDTESVGSRTTRRDEGDLGWNSFLRPLVLEVVAHPTMAETSQAIEKANKVSNFALTLTLRVILLED